MNKAYDQALKTYQNRMQDVKDHRDALYYQDPTQSAENQVAVTNAQKVLDDATKKAKGTNIVNILPLEPGEKVTAGITVREFDEDYLIFVTRNGTVKRLELSVLNTARKSGIRALTLTEGDELISVMKTTGEDDILLISSDGKIIRTGTDTIRVCSRSSQGVRLIRMEEGTTVISIARTERAEQEDESGDDDGAEAPVPPDDDGEDEEE